MLSTLIKFFNKYVLSFEYSLNNAYYIGFFARDSFDGLMLSREFNFYVNKHPGSIIRNQNKFWGN